MFCLLPTSPCRGLQDGQTGSNTSSQAHFDACTCPPSALRSFASRGTPNGSRAALSHNRLRGGYRTPCGSQVSWFRLRSSEQPLVLLRPSIVSGVPRSATLVLEVPPKRR